jgi:hypothetical protein
LFDSQVISEAFQFGDDHVQFHSAKANTPPLFAITGMNVRMMRKKIYGPNDLATVETQTNELVTVQTQTDE